MPLHARVRCGPVAGHGAARGYDHHPRRRRRRLLLSDPSDRPPARAADGSRRPQPQRLAAAPADSERSEHARPGHARHAGRRGRRSVSPDCVVGAVPTRTARSGGRAPARGSAGGVDADGGTAPVPGRLTRAVLGRVGSHLCPGAGRARAGCARADPPLAAGPAGRTRHRRRAAAGREQRERRGDGRAGAGYLQSGPAAGLPVSGRDVHRHRLDRPLPDSIESAPVRAAGVALGGTPRRRAAAHHGARVDPPAPRPGAARRVRADADGHGIDAEPRRQARPGRLAASAGAARSIRDRAADARARAGPVAGAAPFDSGGDRIRGHARLVPVDRGTADRRGGDLRAQRADGGH